MVYVIFSKKQLYESLYILKIIQDVFSLNMLLNIYVSGRAHMQMVLWIRVHKTEDNVFCLAFRPPDPVATLAQYLLDKDPTSPRNIARALAEAEAKKKEEEDKANEDPKPRKKSSIKKKWKIELHLQVAPFNVVRFDLVYERRGKPVFWLFVLVIYANAQNATQIGSKLFGSKLL